MDNQVIRETISRYPAPTAQEKRAELNAYMERFSLLKQVTIQVRSSNMANTYAQLKKAINTTLRGHRID